MKTMPLPAGDATHANPCFDCDKAISGCDWSRSFLPVKGWQAIPDHRNISDTYRILYCPEFQKTPDRGKEAMYGALTNEENEIFLRNPLAFIDANGDMPIMRRKKYETKKRKEKLAV